MCEREYAYVRFLNSLLVFFCVVDWIEMGFISNPASLREKSGIDNCRPHNLAYPAHNKCMIG
jgi:hypothetical protein